MFIDWYLPGFKAGGPIRSVANLVGRLPFHFWIITSRYDHLSSEPYPDIPPGEWLERRPNEHIMYLERGAMNPALMNKIWMEQPFEHVYFNSLFSREFTLRPLAYFRRKGMMKKVILAPRGMLKSGALSVKAPKKKLFLFISRKLGWFKGLTWHATNETEATEIRSFFGNDVRVRVAPNLSQMPDQQHSAPPKKKGVLDLVTVARVSAEKNILGGIEYIAKLEGVEKVNWVIYGTLNENHYASSCRKAAKSIPFLHLTFAGEIAPVHIPEILSRHHFFYLPTLGENYGHAIAESLICGTPVIISDKTPWQDLKESGAGWSLPLDGNAFVEALHFCADMDDDEYKVWQISAQKRGMRIADDPDTISANLKLFSRRK